MILKNLIYGTFYHHYDKFFQILKKCLKIKKKYVIRSQKKLLLIH